MDQAQNPDTQIHQEVLNKSTSSLEASRPPRYKKQYININEDNSQPDNNFNARYRRVRRGEEDEDNRKNLSTEIPKNIDSNFVYRSGNVKINTDITGNNNYVNNSSRLSTNNDTDKKNKYSNTMRNTISGMKKGKSRFNSELIDVILDIEKENVNHYLSTDLANLYEDITNNNQEFKEDVFLANVDNFDKKTGILGQKTYYKKPIYPYPSSKNDINKLIKTFNHTEDIIQKFSERSKTLNNENYD